MTDHVDSLADPSDDDLAALSALLARAATWDEPPRASEDAVVAAITDAIGAADAVMPSFGVPATPAEQRARHRWSTSRLVGAAAALVVIVAGAAVLTRGGTDGVTFALEGTDAEPDAAADVTIVETDAGLKILLDPIGLPGAPDGYMYEAWVGDGTVVVSAGTFHLRGDGGEIELWAGVTDPTIHRLWITLEPIDDDARASTDARLRGEFSLVDD